MFYYIYITKCKDNKLYIGFTDNLIKRIEQHNRGEVLATRNRRPLCLIYYEAFRSKKDALKREIKIKKFKAAYRELKKRIQNSLLT